MQKKNNPITAFVITHNEEKNLEKCLKSVNWVDEIVIVDSYSDDRTVEIASRYTDRIYFRKFDNDFSAQRNFGLKYIDCDWIIALDADEKLPNRAVMIIKKLITAKNIDGFWLPRRNYVDDENYLKHGYFYPDYQLRLFRHRKDIKYSGVIHEQLIINASRTKRINYLEIYHNHSHTKYDSFFSFYRFFPFIRIEGRYMALSQQSGIELLVQGLTEIIKHFCRSFLKEEGYKDGYIGFRAALMYSLYKTLVPLYALVVRIKFLSAIYLNLYF